MDKLTSFQKLLRSLEDTHVSRQQIEKLLEFMQSGSIYDTMFESHIRSRLDDNVHPERLLRLLTNLEQSEKTHYLSSLFNKRMATYLLYSHRGHDQFYYLVRHEFREERNLLQEYIRNLSHHLADEVLKQVNLIAPHVRVDKYSLLLWVMESFDDFMNTRRLGIIERLDAQEQYQLWVKAVESNSVVFDKFANLVSKPVLDIINDRLIQFGDDDPFAKSLITTNIQITKLETCFRLNYILINCSKNIPQTIEHLFRRAEQEGRYEYLLVLGSNKNKKDLLRSIVKSKDHELIDKFFFIYKDFPEVKHLTPFL